MKATRIYKGIEITVRLFVTAHGAYKRYETETGSSNTLKGIKNYIDMTRK
jgi:hypothetical protein